MPAASDLRYNWVRVWLDAIDETEMRELVLDAWRMVVPKAGRGDLPQGVSQGTPPTRTIRSRPGRRGR